MNHLLSQKILRMESSEIRKVFDLAAKVENPLNLSIGQPDFPVPQPVKDAMIQAIRDDKNGYTPTAGLVPLREAISRKWEEKNGFSVSPENILVSTGAASLLHLLFETIFEENDSILFIEPYFLIYPALAKFHNLDINYLHESFGAPEKEQFLENWKQKNKPLKAIIYSNPSNPTGNVFSEEQLKLLAEIAESTGAVIISDEIYEAFDYDDRFQSMAKFLPEKTLTLSGFSKSHAMTGLRVGYLGVPENMKEIISRMASLQQYSVVCAPQPAQWGAIAAINNPATKEIQTMKQRRDYVAERLQKITSLTQPAGAFYTFPQIPVDGSEFAKRALEKRLLLVPGYIFNHDPNFVRLSYAVDQAVLEEGLDVFEELLQEYK